MHGGTRRKWLEEMFQKPLKIQKLSCDGTLHPLIAAHAKKAIKIFPPLASAGTS